MPRPATPKIDNAILEMAIVGYQREADKITARIAEIREQLGKRDPGRPKTKVGESPSPVPEVPKKRSRMSAAGRARIAAAQRARWAAHRKAQAPVDRPAKSAKLKKRKLSAAGLKAIREATKKRRAAYRGAQQAAA